MIGIGVVLGPAAGRVPRHKERVSTSIMISHNRLLEKGNRLVGWLLAHGQEAAWIPYALRGSGEVAQRVAALHDSTVQLCAALDKPCPVELLPQLIDLEGRRVELEFNDTGRRVCRWIDRRQEGVMLFHVAKETENGPGEVLTFGECSLVRVL